VKADPGEFEAGDSCNVEDQGSSPALNGGQRGLNVGYKRSKPVTVSTSQQKKKQRSRWASKF